MNGTTKILWLGAYSYAPGYTEDAPGAGGSVTTAPLLAEQTDGVQEIGSAANIFFEEAIGAGMDITYVDKLFDLLGSDAHSVTVPFAESPTNRRYDLGWALDPLQAPTDPATDLIYSCERWVRVGFQNDPPFNFVRDFRFFAPGALALPSGWSINLGSSAIYVTPSTTPSSIAVDPVPTSNPGGPNCGGDHRLIGTGTEPRYTDWIVLQAVADPTVVMGSGPAMSQVYNGVSVALPIDLTFHWRQG